MTSARDVKISLDKKNEKKKPLTDFRSIAAEIKEDKNENAGNEDTPNKKKEELNAVEENYYNLSKPIMLTNFFVDKPLLCLALVVLGLIIITGLCIVFDWFKTS